jgi:hypothetical protein
MDESVINGANLFFAPQFGIDPNSTDGAQGRNEWLLGLVNSAPYVCDHMLHFIHVLTPGCYQAMLRRTGLLAHRTRKHTRPDYHDLTLSLMPTIA